MAKPDPTALTQAAAGFDEALATYQRLGELFLRSPLETLKHLERANSTLNELADAETRLQVSGQALISAIAGSRDQQQALAQQIVEHAPALTARNARLGELMAALHEIAGEVQKVNTEMASSGTQAHMRTAMVALVERAEALTRAAREAEFPELAEQAHALAQRLQAITKKLATVAGN
ncbi:hypothetical protein BH11MYX1_BH11MYX1_15140 [soil metagenome]